ncbi:MAG TPA: thiamine biosynthesis protein ThiS [Oceanicaulis sp.]|nr:thiamine biosynthesis protein ThiS [Oceanicaulis sp.]
MRVTLNGEARDLPAGLSLSAMLTHLGLDPRKVAVERNLEIAPRSAYDEIAIADGDRLEIVQFVGGG